MQRGEGRTFPVARLVRDSLVLLALTPARSRMTSPPNPSCGRGPFGRDTGTSQPSVAAPVHRADRRTADDAMAESFFAILKTEFYYRHVWPTKTQARLPVGAWIEDRYNRPRRHCSIGQISPVASN